MLILKNAKPLAPERLHQMSETGRQLYRATEASSVRVPYIGMAIVLFLLAVGLASISLQPQQFMAEATRDFRPGGYAGQTRSGILNQRWLLAGALGIFTYVGAEVSIGSLLVNFLGLPSIASLPAAFAAKYLMLYWGGAMMGRFIGSAVLTRLSTGRLLGFAALVSLILVVASVMTHGHVAMFALSAVGFFNSIMFPSIFSLRIQGLGPMTSKGSSLMVAAIVGGAVIPLATGNLADIFGLQRAFLLPALCYVYIAAFGFAAWSRPAGPGSVASH